MATIAEIERNYPEWLRPTMDFAASMRELETAPGVRRGDLDDIRRGILALAGEAATVSGWSPCEARNAVESLWLAYDGPQDLIDKGRRRLVRLSAMHREYARRQRARRRRR